MPKTKEEILADIAKAVEGQGNQGAIAITPILKDIVELAGEGGGGGGDATTIGGIPVFRIDAILSTKPDAISANGTLKIADIASEIYAQVGAGEFLVVSNCEWTETVGDFGGNINYVPGVARGRFSVYKEDDGTTVVEAYVTFVGGMRNSSNKAIVITYGLYLNAQNGYEGNSYAWLKCETTV